MHTPVFKALVLTARSFLTLVLHVYRLVERDAAVPAQVPCDSRVARDFVVERSHKYVLFAAIGNNV